MTPELAALLEKLDALEAKATAGPWLELIAALRNAFPLLRDALRASELDTRRLDWLDHHCSFVADGEYKIGPFAIGELRVMADAGLAADWVNKRISETDAAIAADALKGER